MASIKELVEKLESAITLFKDGKVTDLEFLEAIKDIAEDKIAEIEQQIEDEELEDEDEIDELLRG